MKERKAKKNNYSTNINIRIDQETMMKLIEYSDKKGIPYSKIIRETIQELIKRG